MKNFSFITGQQNEKMSFLNCVKYYSWKPRVFLTCKAGIASRIRFSLSEKYKISC